jgi:tRNA (cytidine32/uridine32-2'-O)-methyltransferase
MLEHIRIVMVETSHPGNIGAAARAMKTMGLLRLYLVKPAQFPHNEADARASGADDILNSAVVCNSLDEALVGCTHVVGASARLRSLPWPLVTPRTCAAEAVSQQGEVALVFGRERSGLSNEELERCSQLVHIPCNPEFSSLNVASAVQLLSYECLLAASNDPELQQDADSEPATREELEGFYTHLEQVLVGIDYLDPDNPRQLMRRLRRLYNRAAIEKTELNILRGILKATLKSR